MGRIENEMPQFLVQKLLDGPIDIVGDVHGEIDALNSLLKQLRYDDDGFHAEGRRLVFVGDLTDRGPDSPAVVRKVRQLIDSEQAQCVLGNHELNILLNERKYDNHWFFGQESPDGGPRPANLLHRDAEREEMVAFFRSLPVALERDDLRIVHACWDEAMVDIAGTSTDAVSLHNEYAEKIEDKVERFPDIGDEEERLKREQPARLALQNENPIKVLTSGREQPAAVPFEASGKLRFEERVQWWKSYTERPFCVFGHYSQYGTVPRRASNAFCIDFAVAKRWQERIAKNLPQDSAGPFDGMLAAMRWPERSVIFDNGDTVKMLDLCSSKS